MNLREVELFAALMTHGTTARTAEVMAISQPAVSKAIQSLERRIGFPLFLREQGRLRPTAEATMFLREVEQSFRGLATLRAAAARIRDFGTGQLRVASMSAFSGSLVPEALGLFHERHPRVAVTLQVDRSMTIVDRVAEGQADVGIVDEESPTRGLHCDPFVTLPAALALPPGHPLTARRVIRPADLDGIAFVAGAPHDQARQAAEAAFRAAGVSPRVVVETPLSVTICALVLSGIGVGIVDPVTAPGFTERGLVLRPMEPTLEFRTQLTFPPGRPPSLLVQEFVELLRRVAEASRVRLEEAFGAGLRE